MGSSRRMRCNICILNNLRRFSVQDRGSLENLDRQLRQILWYLIDTELTRCSNFQGDDHSTTGGVLANEFMRASQKMQDSFPRILRGRSGGFLRNGMQQE